MGCLGSKDRLSKEDMDFLKSHTRYDESTIKEWYKGFKVSGVNVLAKSPSSASADFDAMMVRLEYVQVFRLMGERK